MTMSIDEWFASVDGKSVGPNDTNGQCVGLYYDYMQNCLGITPVSTQYGPHAGYAIGTWDSGQVPAGMSAIAGGSDIRKGDVVFWNWGQPFTPLSHVAIAFGGNQLGTATFASQNSPLPYATKQQLPLLGVAGVWRPAGSIDPGTGLWVGPFSFTTPQLGQAAAGAASGVAGVASAFGPVLNTLGNPAFWKRAGLMVLGVILLLIAFWSIMGESTVTAVNKISKVAKP
jgi:hypothetical protein